MKKDIISRELHGSSEPSQELELELPSARTGRVASQKAETGRNSVVAEPRQRNMFIEDQKAGTPKQTIQVEEYGDMVLGRLNE